MVENKNLYLSMELAANIGGRSVSGGVGSSSVGGNRGSGNGGSSVGGSIGSWGCSSKGGGGSIAEGGVCASNKSVVDGYNLLGSVGGSGENC